MTASCFSADVRGVLEAEGLKVGQGVETTGNLTPRGYKGMDGEVLSDCLSTSGAYVDLIDGDKRLGGGAPCHNT